MQIIETPIQGVVIVEPRVFSDARGYFFESYNQRELASVGIQTTFVQDNHSLSQRGTLRGLHYQLAPGQVKLVRVVDGEVFDVVVDLRRSSPTFRCWHGVTLSADNKRQLYIPVGLAHGFCVISEQAEFLYKVSSYYDPLSERGLAWNDSTVGIAWPVANPILSERDQRHPQLSQILAGDLFA